MIAIFTLGFTFIMVLRFFFGLLINKSQHEQELPRLSDCSARSRCRDSCRLPPVGLSTFGSEIGPAPHSATSPQHRKRKPIPGPPSRRRLLFHKQHDSTHFRPRRVLNEKSPW